MLKQYFLYPINTIIAIPESVLLTMTAFIFLCFIMIMRTDLNNAKSARQKALSVISSNLIRGALIVGFAANRLSSHIGIKKTLSRLNVHHVNRDNSGNQLSKTIA